MIKLAGTVLAPQQLTGRVAGGVAPNFVAAAATMELPNRAPTLLHVKATGAVTVTGVNQTDTPEGTNNPDKSVALTTGQERLIRFDPGTYNMGNGNVQLTFDTPANATVAVYQLI